eukprot:5165123-Alexandrium_andersonii.AAC.1
MSASLAGSEMCIRDSPLSTIILDRAASRTWLAGVATMQGLRRYHEDLFILKAWVEGAPGVGAFAVLDGHGGSQ